MYCSISDLMKITLPILLGHLKIMFLLNFQYCITPSLQRAENQTEKNIKSHLIQYHQCLVNDLNTPATLMEAELSPVREAAR